MDLIKQLVDLLASPTGSAIFVAVITSLVMERVLKPNIKESRQTIDKHIPWWNWALYALGLSFVISLGLLLMGLLTIKEGLGTMFVGYAIQTALSSHINAWIKEKNE